MFPGLGARRYSVFEAMGRSAYDGAEQARRALAGQLPSTYDAQRPGPVPNPSNMGAFDLTNSRRQGGFMEGDMSRNIRTQSDLGLANSKQQLNIRLLVDPKKSRGPIKFNKDEYLCLSICDTGASEDIMSTGDLTNQVSGVTQMNADWREAFNVKKRLIHDGMTRVIDERLPASHANPRSKRRTVRINNTSQPSNPTWVTCVADVNKKYNMLGTYVSTDAVHGANTNGGINLVDKKSGTVMISVKFMGEQVNMANVFGLGTRHGRVGYCIGARQNLNPNVPIEKQSQQPIQWTPWCSSAYKKPFLESDPHDMLRASATPGQTQRILNVMRLGTGSAVVSFLGDLSRTRINRLMEGPEYMNSDLAYLATDVIRDPDTGELEHFWYYETAFFVPLGHAKLVTGKGYAPADQLIGMMDDPVAYRERSNKSRISVRIR